MYKTTSATSNATGTTAADLVSSGASAKQLCTAATGRLTAGDHKGAAELAEAAVSLLFQATSTDQVN